MPLVWAHAEYVKLLRSIGDQKVFDQLPPVAERYLGNRGRKDLEIWKFHRRVGVMAAGKTLRVQVPGPFVLRWSLDGGATVSEATAIESGLGISFVDIKTPADQAVPVQFSFYWSDSGQQDSSSHEVRMRAEKAVRASR